MAEKKYKRIILYGNAKDYARLQEVLQGIPVSVWFRIKVKKFIQGK